MLRIVYSGRSTPASFILEPSAEFMPGQVAELTIFGNQVMATVSNGTAPLGIIDDIRTKAFSSTAWNEVIIAAASGEPNGQGQLVTPIDVKAELKHSNININSFISTVDVALIPTNGVVVFPAGTVLNFDMTGSGTPNAIRTIVNYTYQVPNIPGDDSTIGSGRVTVWYDRMFVATDQYETNQSYPLKANLYVSEKGLFTTRRPSNIHAAVAMVTAPPTPQNPTIELMWY